MTRAALLTVALLAGCSGSAVQVHATAAHAASEALIVAGPVLRQQRQHEQLAAAHGAQYAEDATEAVQAVRGRWQPVLDAYEATRTAVNAWTDALLVYLLDGEEHPELWLRLAADVAQAWSSWAARAGPYGIDIPPPPDLLLTLIGGGR